MHTLTKLEQQCVETAVANLVRELYHGVIKDHGGGTAKWYQDAVTDAVAALAIREILQKYDTSLAELNMKTHESMDDATQYDLSKSYEESKGSKTLSLLLSEESDLDIILGGVDRRRQRGQVGVRGTQCGSRP